MPIQTAKTYHDDKNLHGKYQYVSLKEVVEEMLLESTDSANYLANTKRSIIVFHLKNVIQELNKEVKKTILAMERTVGPSLFFPLEQDYVDWVAVSVVGPDFKLYQLNVNNNIPTAISYLQDSNYELLFDSDGDILKADGINTYNKPYVKYTFDFVGQQAFLDTSCLSKFGEFVIDERRGTIAFSSNMEGKSVVIHYVSDGLQMHNLKEEEITIHKDLKKVLKEWAYHNIIEHRRSDSVPANEKLRAKGAYKASLHKAKIKKANFDINEMVRLKGKATKM